jgi:putative acetyltransferase
MPLRLRPYRSADLEEVTRTFADSVRVLARRDYDEAQRSAWATVDLEDWRARLAAIAVLVAEDVEGIAGFIGYSSDGYVAQLYTASRAARKRVASALYAHVEAGWRAAGVARAYAEVSLTARPFFERQGFDVVEEEEVERRGAIFRRFRMEKALL